MKIAMTAAEWQVMRVLWAHPNSGSAAIIESLSETFDWQPSTIKTLLGRLKKKDLIETTGSRGKYRYKASFKEEEILLAMGQEWLDNQCPTKQGHHLLQLLEKAQLSQEDVARVIAWAEQAKETAPQHVRCTCSPGQCNCHQ